MKIEYRVVPIMRYQVTRYEESDDGRSCGAVSQKGEYDNEHVAYQVAYALCKSEHDQLGYPPADERIRYPEYTPQKSLTNYGRTDEAFRRRIASEIDKLNGALVDHMNRNGGAEHPALSGAQQALCWAMDPECAGQPIKAILGAHYGTTLGETYAGLHKPSQPPSRAA